MISCSQSLLAVCSDSTTCRAGYAIPDGQQQIRAAIGFGVVVVLMRDTFLDGPGGGAGCSHGWSGDRKAIAAQPVESRVVSHLAPAGAKGASIGWFITLMPLRASNHPRPPGVTLTLPSEANTVDEGEHPDMIQSLWMPTPVL